MEVQKADIRRDLRGLSSELKQLRATSGSKNKEECELLVEVLEGLTAEGDVHGELLPFRTLLSRGLNGILIASQDSSLQAAQAKITAFITEHDLSDPSEVGMIEVLFAQSTRPLTEEEATGLQSMKTGSIPNEPSIETPRGRLRSLLLEEVTLRQETGQMNEAEALTEAERVRAHLKTLSAEGILKELENFSREAVLPALEPVIDLKELVMPEPAARRDETSQEVGGLGLSAHTDVTSLITMGDISSTAHEGLISAPPTVEVNAEIGSTESPSGKVEVIDSRTIELVCKQRELEEEKSKTGRLSRWFGRNPRIAELEAEIRKLESKPVERPQENTGWGSWMKKAAVGAATLTAAAVAAWVGVGSPEKPNIEQPEVATPPVAAKAEVENPAPSVSEIGTSSEGPQARFWDATKTAGKAQTQINAELIASADHLKSAVPSFQTQAHDANLWTQTIAHKFKAWNLPEPEAGTTNLENYLAGLTGNDLKLATANAALIMDESAWTQVVTPETPPTKPETLWTHLGGNREATNAFMVAHHDEIMGRVDAENYATNPDIWTNQIKPHFDAWGIDSLHRDADDSWEDDVNLAEYLEDLDDLNSRGLADVNAALLQYPEAWKNDIELPSPESMDPTDVPEPVTILKNRAALNPTSN